MSEKTTMENSPNMDCNTMSNTQEGTPSVVSDTVGEQGGMSTPPIATDTIPKDVEPKQTWGDMPSKGYFHGRPGPGRGHTTGKSGNGSNPAEDATAGVGAVLEAAKAAIGRRGQKFYDDLAKRSPAVLAQLIGTLNKQAGEQPVTGEQNITIAPSPCALPHPGSIDEATAHTIRLEQENLELKARLAKVSGPARIQEPTDRPTWVCQTCLAVAGIERVHDTDLALCPACGARQDGKPSQHKAGSGRPMVGFAAGGGDNDGWQEAGSVHEAVRRGR